MSLLGVLALAALLAGCGEQRTTTGQPEQPVVTTKPTVTTPPGTTPPATTPAPPMPAATGTVPMAVRDYMAKVDAWHNDPNADMASLSSVVNAMADGLTALPGLDADKIQKVRDYGVKLNAPGATMKDQMTAYGDAMKAACDTLDKYGKVEGVSLELKEVRDSVGNLKTDATFATQKDEVWNELRSMGEAMTVVTLAPPEGA